MRYRGTIEIQIEAPTVEAMWHMWDLLTDGLVMGRPNVKIQYVRQPEEMEPEQPRRRQWAQMMGPGDDPEIREGFEDDDEPTEAQLREDIQREVDEARQDMQQRPGPNNTTTEFVINTATPDWW